MGCFMGCFGPPKKGRRRRPGRRVLPREPVISLPLLKVYEQCEVEVLRPSLIKMLPAREAGNGKNPDFRSKKEQSTFSTPKKKVTFDLNVKTYVFAPVYEDEDEDEDQSVWLDADEQKEKLQKEDWKLMQPSWGAFPLNHRYESCSISDDENTGESEDDYYNDYDEEEDEEYEDCDFDGEDDAAISDRGHLKEREVSEVCGTEANNASDPELEQPLLPNQNGRGRCEYIRSVLNPVENLSQWKEVKVRDVSTKQQLKEHTKVMEEPKAIVSSENAFRSRKHQSNCGPSPTVPSNQEVFIDASLSNWLTPQDIISATENQRNCSCNLDDQQILRSLTVENLKMSTLSSRLRPPSSCPQMWTSLAI